MAQLHCHFPWLHDIAKDVANVNCSGTLHNCTVHVTTSCAWGILVWPRHAKKGSATTTRVCTDYSYIVYTLSSTQKVLLGNPKPMAKI